MGKPELLALSLGLSLIVAGLAYGLMRAFERGAPDPVLREKAWATALYLPVAPILLVGAALLLPAPVLDSVAGSGTADFSVVIEHTAPQGAPVGPISERVAIAALVLAGILLLMRAVRLAIRTIRLHLIVRASDAASPALSSLVKKIAHRQAMAAPAVRVRRTGKEALVTGLVRPVLLLPADLISRPDAHALDAVCAHELAHLRRRDHLALWVEEVLLTVFAFNPMLGLIRDHRAAAREEACDAVALAQAGDDTRRLYARSLLDAFRASPRVDDAPALTFSSSRRSLVMHRLKAILSPVPNSGVRQHLTVLGLGVAIAAVAGASSLALAAGREAVPAPRSALAPAAAHPAKAPGVEVAAAPTLAPPKSTEAPAPQAPSQPAPAAAPVAAAPVSAEAAAGVITNPVWDQHPTPSYPKAAIEQGLNSGRADLSCTAQADGRMTGCMVVSEDPVGAGYGAAALEAASRARLSPRTADSVATGTVVRFSVRFRLAAE